MAPITIAESFALEISSTEFVQVVPVDEKYETHKGGRSTMEAEAPKLGIDAPYEEYWALYDAAVLKNPNVSKELSQIYLATPEPTIELFVEADVADASTLQLINPVNLALHFSHPGGIKCLNQHHVSISPGKNESKNKDREAGRARTDKAWLLARKTEVQALTVLDYKRVGTIVLDQFDKAKTTFSEFAERVLKEAEVPGSCFKKNSHLLMKQTVNYAGRYGTKYIAFFD